MSLIFTVPLVNGLAITMIGLFIPIIIFVVIGNKLRECNKLNSSMDVYIPFGYGTCIATIFCYPIEVIIQCCWCNFCSLCEKSTCIACCNSCCPKCYDPCCEKVFCPECCCRCCPYCYQTCCCFHCCAHNPNYCNCCCLRGAMCRHYAIINIMGCPCLGLWFTLTHCFKCITDLFTINKSSILSSFTCFMIVLIQFTVDIMYIMDYEYHDKLINLSYNLMWIFCIVLEYIMLFELLYYRHPSPHFKGNTYQCAVLFITLCNFGVIVWCLLQDDINDNHRLVYALICSFVLVLILLVTALWYAWNMKHLLLNITAPSVVILILIISVMLTVSFDYNGIDFYLNLFLNLLPSMLIGFYAAIWNPDIDVTLPAEYDRVRNRVKRMRFASMNSIVQPSFFFDSLKYYIPPLPLYQIEHFNMRLISISNRNNTFHTNVHNVMNRSAVPHLKLEWLLNRIIRIDPNLLNIIECEVEAFQYSSLNQWNLTVNDCISIVIFVYF
eukprot:19171_1